MQISLNDLTEEDRNKLLEEAKEEIRLRDEQMQIERRLVCSKTKLYSTQEERVSHILCNDRYSGRMFCDRIRNVANYIYKAIKNLPSSKQLKFTNDNQFDLYETIYVRLTDAVVDIFEEAKKILEEQNNAN